MALLDNQFDTRPALGALSSRDQRAALAIDDEIGLTIQIADFARGFGSEAVEGRAVVFVAGQYFEVRAIRKPLIIESLTCVTAAANFFYIWIASPLNTGVEVSTAMADIGGIPTSMQVFVGGALPVPPANTTIVTERISLGADFRAYVEPGQAFAINCLALNTIECQMIVREVADIPKTRG